MLRGVLPISVVEGHIVELWFVYFESQGKWAVLFDDLNTATGIQIIYVETSTIKVKSDYWAFVESGGLSPNSNAQLLGLVEVTSVQKATRIAGDGVSLSNWADGFVITDCSAANDGYGVTDTGTSKFKFGLGGAIETNGAQLW